MKRKIVKQGQGAYTITLPVAWVRGKGLKGGNEIEITEQSGGLVLNTEGSLEEEKKVVLPSADKPFLRTFLAAYYRRGCKRLVVEFKDKIDLKTLQNVSDTLYGSEIVSFDGKTCVFEQLQATAGDSPEALINKTFYYTIRSLDMIIEKKPYDAEEFDAIRRSLLKIRDQTLQKVVKSGISESYELYTMVVFLEKLSTRPFKFYRSVKRVLTDKEIELVKQVKKSVEASRKCFRKKDFGLVRKFYNDMYYLKRDWTVLQKYTPEVGFFYLHSAHILYTIGSRLCNVFAGSESNT